LHLNYIEVYLYFNQNYNLIFLEIEEKNELSKLVSQFV